jgi:hypothetical protein
MPVAARRRVSFPHEVLPHRDLLFAAALRMTRQRNDAEDLVQRPCSGPTWPGRVRSDQLPGLAAAHPDQRVHHGYRRRRRHNRFTNDCPDDAVAAFYGDAPDEARDPKRPC